MIKMAWRFVKSMLRHLWAGWRGYERIAPAGVQAYRERVCRPCVFNKEGQCEKCQCLILAKTMMALEKCPLNFWGRVWIKKVWTKGR